MTEQKTTILIRDIVIEGVGLGVNPEEWQVPTRIIVEIEIDLEKDSLFVKDSIQETVDYTSVQAIAIEVATQKHFNLVETLAHRIGLKILKDHKPSERVRVRIQKPSALSNGTAEVTALLTR